MYLNDPRLVFEPDAHTYDWNGVRMLGTTTVIGEMIPSTAAQFYTEESRIRGKYVHECAMLYLSNELDETQLFPKYRPYLEAFFRFVERSRLQAQHMECRVCDPILGYAGTADIVADIALANMEAPPHVALSDLAQIDIKSGMIPPTVGFQTAGYNRILMPALDRPWIHRAVLNLKDDGNFQLGWLSSFDDEDDFLAMVRVMNIRRRNGRSTVQQS